MSICGKVHPDRNKKVVQQTKVLLRFVDNFPRSFYLAEEGEMRGSFIFFEGKSKWFEARVAALFAQRYKLGLLESIHTLEIVGYHSNINVAPFIGATTGIGAV